MKKYFLLFITIFLLSGCEVNYNLDISEKGISEKTEIFESSISKFDSSDEANYYYNLYTDLPLALYEQDNIINPENDFSVSKIEGIDYYKKSDSNKGVGFVYEGDFKKNNLSDSTIINYGLPFFKYVSTDNEIVINSGSFETIFKRFPLLDEVNVNIKVSDYHVVSNNADKVDKNVYTWNIKKKEDLKKKLEIRLKKGGFAETISTDVKTLFTKVIIWPFILAFFLILVLGYFIYSFVGTKREESNRF